MNRIPQEGHDLVVFEGHEIDNAVNQAVATSEILAGNTVSVYDISLHTENKQTVLVVAGKDYRTAKKTVREIVTIIAKYKNPKSVLAALALTTNAAAAQPEQIAAPEAVDAFVADEPAADATAE